MVQFTALEKKSKSQPNLKLLFCPISVMALLFRLSKIKTYDIYTLRQHVVKMSSHEITFSAYFHFYNDYKNGSI